MKLIKHSLIILLSSCCLTVHAYTPIFTMTPINVPSIVVAGQTTILSYQITTNTNAVLNQPNAVKLNNISPAVATFLTSTSPNDCQLTETFSGRTTCTLKLLIDTTNLQPGQVITGKPIFCNHPELAHPMYCSQPAAAINIKVASPDDPGLSAVTIKPSDSVNLYPGEAQTVTITNTSGDNVTLIHATTDATDDFTIANNCSGQLNQGASCTVVLNTTNNPTIGARDFLTIEANDYEPIKLPVVISAVTVITGTYINATDIFEGLIWTKRTAWTKILPTALAAQPIILFNVANDAQHINDWLVIGTTRNNNTPTPWPPKPPYSFHDKPVILESTDNAQNFTQVTPNIALPENATLLSESLNDELAIFAGFDGELTIDPSRTPKVEGEFTPLMITRDHGVWNNETVNLLDAKTGALMSVTSNNTNQYAAGIVMNTDFGIALPLATLWQRQLDPTSNTYVWNTLDYTADPSTVSSIFGIFFSVFANGNNLVAVGTNYDFKTNQITSLLIVGNYDATQQQWTWSQFPPAPSTVEKTNASNLTFSELSSVSNNPTAATKEAAWVAVGYSAITTGNKQAPLTDAQPLIYVNTSQNADATTWQAIALSTTIPKFERWELDSVTWNGQQWIAVGTRYDKNPIPLFHLQPLVLISEDGLKWIEVLNGLPQHQLTELVPLLFGAR
jgi:hypothetical protein